jgi:hypothetical protein
MGGNVIAEAARLMPERVLGLIGIDTLENVEYKMTTEDMNNMLSPFREDFRKSVRSFAGDMIIPSTDPVLREWIISDMAAAPPSVDVKALCNGGSRNYVQGNSIACSNGQRQPVAPEHRRQQKIHAFL